jgi:ribulose-5-phosphate 4-epimerase/fuculose-1-phosphate aldolase
MASTVTAILSTRVGEAEWQTRLEVAQDQDVAHGLLIVGTSIAAAFVATYRMERACAMQLAFQQSGAAFCPINDEAVTAYKRPMGGSSEPARFEWPALLRKLDRIAPSYKQ